MVSLPPFLTPHTVTVATRGPDGGTRTPGTHKPPVEVVCRVTGVLPRVLSPEAVAAGSVNRLYTNVEHAPLFTPGTLVTWAGKTTPVTQTTVWTDGGVGGMEHVEVVF